MCQSVKECDITDGEKRKIDENESKLVIVEINHSTYYRATHIFYQYHSLI